VQKSSYSNIITAYIMGLVAFFNFNHIDMKHTTNSIVKIAVLCLIFLFIVGCKISEPNLNSSTNNDCLRYDLIQEPCIEEEQLSDFYRFEYSSSHDTSLIIRLVLGDSSIRYVVKKIPPSQFSNAYLQNVNNKQYIQYTTRVDVSNQLLLWQKLEDCLTTIGFDSLSNRDTINAMGAPFFTISKAINGKQHSVRRQLSHAQYFYCGQIFLAIAGEDSSRYSGLLKERSGIDIPIPFEQH
jgi:hypothetical protein